MLITPRQVQTNTTASGTSGQNFINVTSTAGFTSAGFLSIDGGEIVIYTGITATQFQNVQRGIYATAPEAFNNGASIDQIFLDMEASGYVTIPIP